MATTKIDEANRIETVDRADAVVRGVKLICPFCNRVASIGYTANGDCAIDHELPVCAKFIALDPVEYARAVRIRLSS